MRRPGLIYTPERAESERAKAIEAETVLAE